jgi:hypothetical protein
MGDTLATIELEEISSGTGIAWEGYSPTVGGVDVTTTLDDPGPDDTAFVSDVAADFGIDWDEAEGMFQAYDPTGETFARGEAALKRQSLDVTTGTSVMDMYKQSVAMQQTTGFQGAGMYGKQAKQEKSIWDKYKADKAGDKLGLLTDIWGMRSQFAKETFQQAAAVKEMLEG